MYRKCTRCRALRRTETCSPLPLLQKWPWTTVVHSKFVFAAGESLSGYQVVSTQRAKKQLFPNKSWRTSYARELALGSTRTGTSLKNEGSEYCTRSESVDIWIGTCIQIGREESHENRGIPLQHDRIQAWQLCIKDPLPVGHLLHLRNLKAEKNYDCPLHSTLDSGSLLVPLRCGGSGSSPRMRPR